LERVASVSPNNLDVVDVASLGICEPNRLKRPVPKTAQNQRGRESILGIVAADRTPLAFRGRASCRFSRILSPIFVCHCNRSLLSNHIIPGYGDRRASTFTARADFNMINAIVP